MLKGQYTGRFLRHDGLDEKWRIQSSEVYLDFTLRKLLEVITTFNWEKKKISLNFGDNSILSKQTPPPPTLKWWELSQDDKYIIF